MRIEVSAVGTDDVVSFRCSAGAGAAVHLFPFTV